MIRRLVLALALLCAPLAGHAQDISAPGVAPGGSNAQVQFNDSGAFGGDAGLTYNKTTDALTIAGSLTAANAKALVDVQAGGDINTGSGGVKVYAGDSNRTAEFTHYQYGTTIRTTGYKSQFFEFFLGDASAIGDTDMAGLSVRHNGSNYGAVIQARNASDTSGLFVDFRNAARAKITLEDTAASPDALSFEHPRSTGYLSFWTNSAERMRIYANGMVSFGGTSSSSPALVPSGARLDVKLADNSTWADVKLSQLTVNNGIVMGQNNISQIGQLTFGASNDAILVRDAANTLAQRNGVNAQTFNVYQTYTDASNYARLGIQLSGGTALIQGQSAGTGGNVDLFLNAGTLLRLATGGTDRWKIDGSGHFIANADNTYDIGASGANRPRDVYIAGSYNAGGGLIAGSTGLVYWSARSILSSPSDGVIRLTNNAQNDFSRLQFGGTTSSFPAIKRSSAALAFRLADDSADAAITAQRITASEQIVRKGYTVAGLPTGVIGGMAYVTDAVACTFLATPTGGGSTFCPVIYSGAAWLAE